MKTQRLFCASALALAAAAAGAQEATQLPIEASVLTRAEVKAELARARAAGEIASGEESDFRSNRVYARSAPAAILSRAQVRKEAVLAARAPSFDSLYVGG